MTIRRSNTLTASRNVSDRDHYLLLSALKQSTLSWTVSAISAPLVTKARMTTALQRFVDAQRPVYDRVISELRNDKKQSHWMWFIFPQIAGLAHSEMSKRFAIIDLPEALTYVQHHLLGPRLIECTNLVLAIKDKKLDEILGHPDDIKFHSSMTLFNAAAPDNRAFRHALDTYFLGQGDDATVSRLARQRLKT